MRALIVMSVVASLQSAAQAEILTWRDVSGGACSETARWDPKRLPSVGDDVRSERTNLLSGNGPGIVKIDTAYGPTQSLRSLTAGARRNDSAQLTLDLQRDLPVTGGEWIGLDGNAELVHAANVTHTVGSLGLGSYDGHRGTYTLSAGTLVVNDGLGIAGNGHGLFKQTGGTHLNYGGINLGGSDDTYSAQHALDGGSLTVTSDIYDRRLRLRLRLQPTRRHRLRAARAP